MPSRGRRSPEVTDDETIEPRPPRTRDRRRAGRTTVEVEILHHPDLRRVGEVSVLGDAADETLAKAAGIGRSWPAFTAPFGESARALDDPCLSRNQLTVRWLAVAGKFSVSVEASARRSVDLWTLTGERLGAPPRDAPPGTLVNIGDRVLLLLAVRSADDGRCRSELKGASASLRQLRARISALAALDETVLVTGETGTGKDLVARAIHANSTRHAGPFTALNCAALPEALLESELFGYKPGSFSGANGGRLGLMRAAAGGTLFLDEIGELSAAGQAKVLRVLQTRAVRPIGSEEESSVDVRIVAATNRDLLADERAGRFRADLRSRIEGLRVDAPPLREHREDVPVLFWSFFAELARSAGGGGLSAFFREADDEPPIVPVEFTRELLAHGWPYNVRELEKYAAATAALNLDGGEFVWDPLSTNVVAAPATDEPPLPDADTLIAALEHADFVQQRAARALGVSHTTLDRWLKQHAISRAKDLDAAAIQRALAEAGGDVKVAARRLRVSERGLVLRMGELGLGKI